MIGVIISPSTPVLQPMASKTPTSRRLPRLPPIDLPDRATVSAGIAELRRQGLTRRANAPDLSRLPYPMRKTIKDAGDGRTLSMDNARRAIAKEDARGVVGRVFGIIASTSPAQLGDLPRLLGVDHVPGLRAITRSRTGREALARAFKAKLAGDPAAKAAFLNVSFLLQADAYPNCDMDHPLCGMWNRGGLHAALYMDREYRDKDVAEGFGLPSRGGGRGRGRRGRGTRKCRGRSTPKGKSTRKRKSARR
jgi:hypothetical protein